MHDMIWSLDYCDPEDGGEERDLTLAQKCEWVDRALGLGGEVLLMGHGTMTRRGGESSGFAGPWRRMADALRDDIFSEYEIDELWEHEGALFVRGVHSDRRRDDQVELELRPMREEELEAMAWAMLADDAGEVGASGRRRTTPASSKGAP